MKILHVNNQARFHGGVEQILFDLATSMSAEGQQGLLFTEGGSTQEFDTPFSWSGMCLREAIEDFKPDVTIIHKVDDANVIKEIAAALPTQMYVHDHDLTCPRHHKYVFGSDQACQRKAGMSCLTNLCFVERAPADNILPVTLFEGVKRQRGQIASARHCDGLIVASGFMKSTLIQNGIPADRITVIPPIPRSIDAIRPQPMPDAPNLLYVGQVIRGKGVDLLIRAMAALPADITLTVAGTGNHLEACQQLADELGLSSRIHFAGWVKHDALDAYYKASQVLVVPSRWPEPFGMVGLEAMARGRPVVAFDTGGISDWLDHGETGRLAQPGNVEDLARNVLMMLNTLVDDQQREQVSRLAAMSAKQRFSHHAFVAGLIQQLEETANERIDIRLRCR